MGFVAETWNLARWLHIFIRNTPFCHLNPHKPGCIKDFEQPQSELHHVQGLSLRRLGAAQPPKLLGAPVGAAVLTPCYFPQPGPEGQRESACPMGMYLHAHGRACGGDSNPGQATVTFKGSSVALVPRSRLLVLMPCQGGVTGRLPLGVQSGPRWRQTVFSWAGGRVQPSWEELACCAQPLGAVAGCRWV